MKNEFKYILILVLLLFTSSTALFSNHLTNFSAEKTAENVLENIFSEPHYSADDFNFYSKSVLFIDTYIEKGIISDSEDDNFQNSSSKKNLPQLKLDGCPFKLYYFPIASLSKNKITECYPSYFQSRTASSLYLIFEVFRI